LDTVQQNSLCRRLFAWFDEGDAAAFFADWSVLAAVAESNRADGSADVWKGTFSDSVMQNKTKQKISSFLITITILIFINYLVV
jgi:hypothetical protein